MKYDLRCTVPTALMRCAQLRVAIHEPCAFLPQTIERGGEAVGEEERKPSRGTPLVVDILMVAFVLGALLLGVAAAKADPVSLSNQATLIRINNGIAFGAVQHAQTEKRADVTIAQFAIFEDWYRLKSRQLQLPDYAKPEIDWRLLPITSIAGRALPR
jgi:hypothetical protein